jgi:hypothetical protein
LIIPPGEIVDFSRIEKAELEFTNLIGQAHVAAVTTKYTRLDGVQSAPQEWVIKNWNYYIGEFEIDGVF